MALNKVYPRKWEEVNDDEFAGCARLKIYGGWIVVAWTNVGMNNSEGLIYVPDPEHKWKLKKKKDKHEKR